MPEVVARPRSAAEVADLVADAAARGRRVKAIGAGHSFTPIAMTSGVLVSLDDLGDVVAVDPARSRVTVGAGIRLHELNQRLAALDLALPNLGDINTQSLAGAISTATHGTGRELPNIGAAVVGIELVTGTGEIVVAAAPDGGEGSVAADGEVLRAARAGLGALGILTQVTLQCVRAFDLHAVETIEPLAAVLDDFDAVTRSADHVELYWMPGARRCQVKRNHRTTEARRPQGRLGYVRDKWIGENLAFGLVCRVGRRVPALAPKVSRLVTAAAAERDFVDRSDKVFSSPRHVRFVEMEYSIELDAVPEALARIGRLAGGLAFPPLFPVEVRVSAGDDAPLSSGYGRTNGWIAVHQYRGAPYESYFQGVERIMDDYGGRPHWGKMHYQHAGTLADRYPLWDRFAAVRAALDPQGVFRNPYLDRVLGLQDA